MGMLDRIKKRSFDGFKEFVLSMETTGGAGRQQILMAGILEDPIFMSYVMKNVRTFDDFLNLPSGDIDTVLKTQDQIMSVMAKCIFGMPEDKIKSIESSIPKYMSKLKDELSYLKEVTPGEKEGAKYFILRIVRKLQQEENIEGFRWELPPNGIFHPRIYKDGKAEIYFESGVLAATGDIVKGRRFSAWKHYYDTGTLMAEGEYYEGLKTGVWIYYFGNGKIRSQGKYKSDLKQGQWKEWDRSGVETLAEFNDGIKKN
jgi:antitoxin component YwqK of YwqJK toxin-antitoxin module